MAKYIILFYFFPSLYTMDEVKMPIGSAGVIYSSHQSCLKEAHRLNTVNQNFLFYCEKVNAQTK